MEGCTFGDAWMEQSGAFRLECCNIGMFGIWICGCLLSTQQGCLSALIEPFVLR